MISVVVPIFNEEEIVTAFHATVAASLRRIGEEWEVVYVNDGSRDSSLELLRGLQMEDSHVVVVDLSRNWGHMGAISAGLQTARGDAIVLMDGDFQDPPEVIPELVESCARALRWWSRFAAAARKAASFWLRSFRSSIACLGLSPISRFR